MADFKEQLAAINRRQELAEIVVHTLGGFQVWKQGNLIEAKAWERDSSIQLFQLLLTTRRRHALHKEQIIDHIWPELTVTAGKQHFKAALYGLNKALEPNRPARSSPRYLLRQGQSYQLQHTHFWIDADAMEAYIALGNQQLPDAPAQAELAFAKALEHYQGVYLPNRLYEDWSSGERERIQMLSLNTMTTKAELLLPRAPQESIRLAQSALLIEPAWEEAYRLQMLAYLQKGNRPMAIKVYQQCQEVLQVAYGIAPLPATRKLYHEIMDQ